MVDDPELKNLIRENSRLVEENHQMIEYIYKRTRLASIYTVVKWIIIIGITVGLFYFLKPVFDSLNTTYHALTGHDLSGFSKFFGN